MAKDFEKGPPGPFPQGPMANLGASFGHPAVETVDSASRTPAMTSEKPTLPWWVKRTKNTTKGLGELGYADGDFAK